MEYWIVDPLRYWVETYQRKKNKFEKFQRKDKTGNLISSVLSDFSITLEKMFSA
ncbi:MAG TPA: Uma2 family endonuclease [Caldithrix abyssi]|uniref:Uma2 family endonuclease n=1 Tax=Caldithrix abyssi TaxID=187145 RepID=A0A7V5PNJ2_CALAY|nr:Uma2 family endonuclease [Caldithrix abyssi]